MKRIAVFAFVTVLALAGMTGNSSAATYPDSVGENFTTAGGGILDITSVEVNNNATDLMLKINLAGDPTATDWGKYMVGIHTSTGGDPVGNGWGRPIGMSVGMNYWLGSWVDSGNGVQLFQYTGAWAQTGGSGPFAGGPPLPDFAISKTTSSVSITVPLLSLGVAPGSTILFDVFTSGGGGTDSAVDALANPAQSISDWGVAYNSGNNVDSYTIAQVPEPAACALLGLGGLLVLQRTFRRNA